jgi:hypothetical protein
VKEREPKGGFEADCAFDADQISTAASTFTTARDRHPRRRAGPIFVRGTKPGEVVVIRLRSLGRVRRQSTEGAEVSGNPTTTRLVVIR